MTEERRRASVLGRHVTATALLGALALVWILGTAPSGGPDEPVHIIRGAALVRGQLDGERFPGKGRIFELPAWIGHPDHGCFSLRSEQPANCATDVPARPGDEFLVTTAVSYPIWGHLVPGLATFLPATVGNQAARVFDAALPILLLVCGLALAARRSGLALASATLAVTPMAWFSIVVVNPSGLVIAGGFAMWTSLLSIAPQRTDPDTLDTDGGSSGASAASPRLDRLTAWTLAFGWAAAVLPRRDGMIWATLIVVVVVMVGKVDVRRDLMQLGRGPLIVIAASTLATMAWGATSGTASSKWLIAVPLLVFGASAFRSVWDRIESTRYHSGLAGIAALASVGVAALLMGAGRKGIDMDLFELVIGQSGLNIEEAIGVLGWLDAPIPTLALLAWIGGLGMLAGVVASTGEANRLLFALVVLLTGIAGSWVLEMTQGGTSGTYWQGRYFLPFLIGIPLILGWTRRSSATPNAGRSKLEAGLVAGTALVVLTAAFAGSMRRWGVGVSGSMWPWDWDTYDAPLPPWILLVIHLALAGEIYRRIVSHQEIV